MSFSHSCIEERLGLETAVEGMFSKEKLSSTLTLSLSLSRSLSVNSSRSMGNVATKLDTEPGVPLSVLPPSDESETE